jgi:hypothetical protein
MIDTEPGAGSITSNTSFWDVGSESHTKQRISEAGAREAEAKIRRRNPLQR